MKMILLAIAFVMSLALLGSGSASAASQTTLPPPTGWKAILIAGDDQEPAFDNAVDGMADKLAAFGVQWSNMTILKATGRDRSAATKENIRAAFESLTPAATDGCFVFITSHGAPRRGLFMSRARSFLGPRDLAALLDIACRDRPTVVIASGCYSGNFAEGPSMPAANRIILTAARDDRSSFGCNADLKFTIFDYCILNGLDRGATWQTVMDTARSCVAEGEQSLHVAPPSTPQMSIGAAVGNLLAFPRDSRTSIP
jgi:hypothetical protein